MPSAEDVIRIAEGEVGATSGERYWDAYWGGSWAYVDGWSTPYCACFVSWVLQQAGVSCHWFPSAVAFDWSVGQCVAPEDLKAGDAVAFDWDGDLGGDHVGFVKSVHDWGIVTVEGNTSGGRVCECQRPWSVVICGLRPEYDEEVDDVISEEDVQRIAAACASYVWGDEDRERNLNMYNAAHWGFTLLERIAAKIDLIIERLGA